MTIIAQMISENTEFCRYYLDNPTFMNMVNQRIFDLVYKDITEKKDDTKKRLYSGSMGVIYSIPENDGSAMVAEDIHRN